MTERRNAVRRTPFPPGERLSHHTHKHTYTQTHSLTSSQLLKHPGQNPTANPAGFTTSLTTTPASTREHPHQLILVKLAKGESRRAEGDGLVRQIRQGMTESREGRKDAQPRAPHRLGPACVTISQHDSKPNTVIHHPPPALCNLMRMFVLVVDGGFRQGSWMKLPKADKYPGLAHSRLSGRQQSLTNLQQPHRTTGHPGGHSARHNRVSRKEKKKENCAGAATARRPARCASSLRPTGTDRQGKERRTSELVHYSPQI